MSDRDKEIEALARLLCRLQGVNEDALVAVGEPYRVQAGVLLGYEVSRAIAYTAWKWNAPTAEAILDAGWSRAAPTPENPEDRDARLEEEDVQRDAEPSESVEGEQSREPYIGHWPWDPKLERFVDPASRTVEDKWRDNAGLR